MNKRIKRKRWIAKLNNQTTARQRKANRELCRRYPFLIPWSWSGKQVWDVRWNGKRDKPYSTTLTEAFPSGWWKAFGLELCEELRQDLIKCNYLYDFRILEIKEKWGHLRVYTGSLPEKSNAWKIIDDYSALSANICISCGKPDVCVINMAGWIQPICFDCFYKQKKKVNHCFRKKRLTNEEIKELYQQSAVSDPKMSGARIVMRNEETITYDLSAKAEKIRARWKIKGGDK